ncbi:CapA family protein [Carboxylicivirga marina]|uniref:CapA family protein n=1 Tax=Carboxylicivirga marina TaxID=2800988 RepID=A0ABS1HLZ5_9BACT|nr:CapA family protein [Carboxylicivirga marina]MBK3518678.1 CapA family protein [Carboxylicivirga marina]
MNNLVFTGDVCFNGHFIDEFGNGRINFDESLKAIIQNSSGVIYNLEAPIVKPDFKVRNNQKANLTNPENLFSLLPRANRTMYNLANNHSFDYGIDGLLHTMNCLKKNELHFLGVGLSHDKLYKKVVLELDDKKVHVYAFSINEGDSVRKNKGGVITDKLLKQLRNEFNMIPHEDVIILNSHIGEEYTLLPSPTKRKLFKSLAKSSRVDVIISHHPHTPQGFEYYNDTLICYSLGNFVFDYDSHKYYPYTDKGMVLELNFDKEKVVPSFYIVKINSTNYSLRLLQFSSLRLKDKLNNFTNYRVNWRRECHRIMYNRKNLPHGYSQVELKHKSIIKLVLSYRFYCKVIALIKDPYNRSVYWNAFWEKNFKNNSN